MESEQSQLNGFMSTLKINSNHNKYIKIPEIGSSFDGNYIFIEKNKYGFSWYISEEKSDDEIIDQSDDSFKTIDLCLNDLRYYMA